MKPGNLKLMLGAFAVAVALCPNVGWSTHAFGGVVTGQVTATPLEGTIEVDHRVYRITANSPADKALRNFSAGLTVDLILDGPAGSPTTHVVGITRHTGT
jgi:hypothetical protein